MFLPRSKAVSSRISILIDFFLYNLYDTELKTRYELIRKIFQFLSLILINQSEKIQRVKLVCLFMQSIYQSKHVGTRVKENNDRLRERERLGCPYQRWIQSIIQGLTHIHLITTVTLIVLQVESSLNFQTKQGPTPNFYFCFCRSVSIRSRV